MSAGTTSDVNWMELQRFRGQYMFPVVLSDHVVSLCFAFSCCFGLCKVGVVQSRQVFFSQPHLEDYSPDVQMFKVITLLSRVRIC